MQSLLYFNVIEQNRGWGSEAFVHRYLEKLGVDVTSVDYRAHRDNLCRTLLAESVVPDAILLQRGDYFPVRILRSYACPRLLWASELMARRREQRRLVRTGRFDHVFVRSPTCQQIARDIEPGIESSILLSAFDPQLFFPLEVEKDIDVLFVGAITPRRRTILDRLQSMCTVTVAKAFGPDFNTLVARARVILNLHAEDKLDTETRVFEVLGAGGFLLSETLSEENPFSSGEHLVEVGSLNQLADAIVHYLSDSDERGRIAQAGYELACAQHTWLHRARQIVRQTEQEIATASNAQGSGPSRLTLGTDWIQRLRQPALRRVDAVLDSLGVGPQSRERR